VQPCDEEEEEKRKMGYGNNNNAMQSVAIVPASATPRFANHTTFPRFTKTVRKRMLYRPELTNASCLVSKPDHGSLSLSLSLTHTHTHSSRDKALETRSKLKLCFAKSITELGYCCWNKRDFSGVCFFLRYFQSSFGCNTGGKSGSPSV
jgi:hypothetical protein